MDFKGDIHTNGTPKSSQDSLLKKDNLALMGDPMDKIGGKKEEHSFISGLSVGQIGNQCPGPLGENGFGQTFKTDRFGLTQQGLNPNANINMNMGLPPFQSTKHPTMVESQMTSSLPYNEPPKPLLAPNKPSDANTHNIMDKPAVKEDTTAKAKMEKIDPSPKADIMNTPENTEKADTKKVDNVSKIQETEKQDSKTEKSGKLEKTSNAEEIKKDMKEEKKNGGEKVDKTVKNEKNVKAAKETSKSTTPTGTKGLISPDKAKSSKQNSSKPNSHSTGQNTGAITSNSANKKGPVAKKTSPTGSKKPPGITSSHVAKTSENNTSAQRKPPVPKFNGASTPKSSAGTKTSGSSVKPPQTKTPTNAASTAATDGAPRASRITKPPVPKQVPLSKKPPVPRAPRNTRISNTPMPDLKNVSSKIGSTDNMKYQPGGGKVQIVHKKMDFSHITSRCGSKDNIKHIPGGGNVQILNKKVDLSKVTSKCGSKDNLNHKPVGGNGKVESQKSKINSTAGSMDNVSQGPGGDHAEKAETQQKSEQSPPMKEKDLKETPTPTPASSEGQRLWNSPSQDKHIPATN